MTDADLVEKKLAFVETCLSELRRLARSELLEQDVRERRFVEHTLQLAIQACLDVASHITSHDRLGEPTSNQQLFEQLALAGWISQDVADVMRAAAGFRNVLVHGYTSVDTAVTRDVLDHHLGDLQQFVDAIRVRMVLARP